MLYQDYDKIKSPRDLKHPLNGLYMGYFFQFIRRFDNFKARITQSGYTVFCYNFTSVAARRIQYEEYLHIEIDEVHIYCKTVAMWNKDRVYEEYYMAHLHESLSRSLNSIGQHYNMPKTYKFHINNLTFHPLKEWDGK